MNYDDLIEAMGVEIELQLCEDDCASGDLGKAALRAAVKWADGQGMTLGVEDTSGGEHLPYFYEIEAPE